MSHQNLDMMPLTPNDRKAILARAGTSQADIARELEVDFTLVSHVIAGRVLTGPGAKRIMEYVARLAGRPIHLVFPVDPEPEQAAS